MKKLQNIVKDIYSLFEKKGEPERSNDQLTKAAHKMGRNIATICLEKLSEIKHEREPTIRLSGIGRPSRQLWYELKKYPKGSEPLASDQIKFLYGNILEELLLFLSYAAGHTVTEKQKKVEIEGVTGHKDCRIDGVTVDIKSA